MSGEYNNSSVGSASCNYAALSQYNGNYPVGVPFQGKVASAMVVPAYGAIGYDALTNATPNCSGYFDINAAYGSDAGNCQTQYNVALCAPPSNPQQQ
jgi:hypothetical protein